MSRRRTQPTTRYRIEEARVLHLFPCLVAPPYVLGRVGIVLVRWRIVVPGGGDNFRAGGHVERLVEEVVRLPVEVVARHVEDHLGRSVGLDELVLPLGAAQVR